jgi:hypothetical protein
MDIRYDYSVGAGDNGNVIGITNNRDTTRSQQFTYDQVNRLGKKSDSLARRWFEESGEERSQESIVISCSYFDSKQVPFQKEGVGTNQLGTVPQGRDTA